MKLDELATPKGFLEPHPGDVAVAGPEAPHADQIEDLIKLLVTIHSRFGNTAVKYRMSWGASALWVEDAQKTEIDKLRAQLERSKRKVKKLKACDRAGADRGQVGHV